MSPASMGSRGPVRAPIRPVIGAITASGANSGSSMMPAISALWSRICCRYRVSTKMTPMPTKFIAAATPFVPANGGVRTRLSGSIGAVAVRSRKMNAAPLITVTAAPAAVTAAEADVPAAITVNTSAPSASAAVAIPGRSSRAARLPSSAPTRRIAAVNAIATTGRFIQNTVRQPAAVTRTPPSTGPVGRASAEMPAQMPSARACSARSGNVRLTTASVPGSSTAAARPCRARKPISTPMFGAAEQPRDARPNKTSPVSTENRCPIRSPTTPAVSSSAARATV